MNPTAVATMARLRRLAAVRTYELADQLLVYVPARKLVTALNAPARAVWDLCDGTRSEAEVVEQLGRRLGARPEEIAEDVTQAIEALSARGLLEDRDSEPATSRLQAFLDFDGTVIAVESNSDALLETVRHRFEHLLCDRTEAVGTCHVLEQGGTFDIFRDPEKVHHARAVDSATDLVEHEIFMAWIEARPDLVWLHAGAVAYQGRALLVVAPAGHGKSTFTTRLVGRGWSYLSDEAVAIDPVGARALALPLCPKVRAELRVDATPVRLEEIERREVRIPRDLVCRAQVPVGAVLFPQFALQGPESLELCSPAEAALLLLENCQTFARGGETAMRVVVDVAQRLPAFRLSYRSSTAALELAQPAILEAVTRS